MDASPIRRAEQAATLPSSLVASLDAVQVPVPAASLRALAAAALPGQKVTPERLGRVAAYEETNYLRARGTPRFCWVLGVDGAAVTPRIWARGTWRLSRRMLTEDAVPNWSATLAIFLCDQMINGDDRVRATLADVAMEAVARVLGPLALNLPGPPERWSEFQRLVAAEQHPLGPASTTAAQDSAATHLEAEGLTPYSLYFGVGDTVLRQPDRYPPRLRLPHKSEAGTAFDQLVLTKAGGDQELAREVLAYLQEWGWLIDHLGREPSFEEYAERWRVDVAAVRERNARFRSLFPSETTPDRVWRLLWDGTPGDSFVRLIGRPVIESDLPPTVINHFVNCLAFELREETELGRLVIRETATFEERDGSAERQLRRFFALCDRALRIWSAQALLSAGEPALVQGLLSLESVSDDASARYAEQMLGEYRRQLADGAPGGLLLEAQKALRVAATLEALDPPSTTGPYLPGVQWAARALSLARNDDIEIDLVKEAQATVRSLDAVY
jgi:hypothetical protein